MVGWGGTEAKVGGGEGNGVPANSAGEEVGAAVVVLGMGMGVGMGTVTCVAVLVGEGIDVAVGLGAGVAVAVGASKGAAVGDRGGMGVSVGGTGIGPVGVQAVRAQKPRTAARNQYLDTTISAFYLTRPPCARAGVEGTTRENRFPGLAEHPEAVFNVSSQGAGCSRR